ncbi:hypothetical protein FOMA001_g13177 [Fusarium oxysporum f. sp. matthiolae]|nr:hypothetical protein FOMA001_g13177 [Fusarium oxysporum f. sp. matthiolae]
MSMKGKVAIVTGGSRGIGASIAKELGKRGAMVAITYAVSSSQADTVVETIKSTSDAIALQADCKDPASPEKVISATVQAFGERIDIIVNNAGVGDELYLEDITLEHFDKVMYTNVRFPIFLLQKALPYLQRGGRVVNLSSVAARQGRPEFASISYCVNQRETGFAMQSVYGASKACLESLARTYAVELGHKYGITINAVNPGAVATDMWRQVLSPSSFLHLDLFTGIVS